MRNPKCEVKKCRRDALLTLYFSDGSQYARCLRHQCILACGRTLVKRVYHYDPREV